MVLGGSETRGWHRDVMTIIVSSQKHRRLVTSLRLRPFRD